MTDPTSIPALVLFNNGGFLNPGEADLRRRAPRRDRRVGRLHRRARARPHLPAARRSAHGAAARPARGSRAHVARELGRFRPVRSDSVALRPRLCEVDRQSPRFPGNQDSGIISEEAFHHSGFGGSIGLADPRADLSLGYVMNKQGQGTLFNPRGQSLVDAAYRSLGYTEVAGNYVR